MTPVLAVLACVAQLQQMEQDFHATYATPPDKPAQAQLIGRDGQILDAATYRKRLAELATARKACAAERAATGMS